MRDERHASLPVRAPFPSISKNLLCLSLFSMSHITIAQRFFHSRTILIHLLRFRICTQWLCSDSSFALVHHSSSLQVRRRRRQPGVLMARLSFPRLAPFSVTDARLKLLSTRHQATTDYPLPSLTFTLFPSWGSRRLMENRLILLTSPVPCLRAWCKTAADFM